jgi:hypothetical protein
MSKLRSALVFLVAGLLVACGGKVVVDVGGGTAGAGGAGGTTNIGSGGFGAETNTGGASCFNPPDPASLTFCGGSGSSGGQCENDFCDADGNVWAAVCQATACQCKFNGLVMCTCAANTTGADFCSGTPTCCPLPKI